MEEKRADALEVAAQEDKKTEKAEKEKGAQGALAGASKFRKVFISKCIH